MHQLNCRKWLIIAHSAMDRSSRRVCSVHSQWGPRRYNFWCQRVKGMLRRIPNATQNDASEFWITSILHLVASIDNDAISLWNLIPFFWPYAFLTPNGSLTFPLMDLTCIFSASTCRLFFHSVRDVKLTFTCISRKLESKITFSSLKFHPPSAHD